MNEELKKIAEKYNWKLEVWHESRRRTASAV